ncbi:Asp23/Gls24 family envelope stress response protein [Glaciihabitans arcticus]|uniref:Asp23/Gls24 family envelope stress response protein n=1 Tax=Glaciihabitans arcticus TaxID=2668039 RepID=A0A4Q9GY67_9MICO|nr:Asp23/Gls24 family envelope stress response protein [Glaciihabitans arcticus]TBN58197.1 Asp23/Gls24 family envelope stress response protein [Glaciihabitans arcticus]
MAVQKASTTPVTVTDLGNVTVASGTTVIVDPVIAKIAGIAAREVPGVFALGGGAARVVGAIRDAIGSTDLSQGVKVEVGETQVAADVTIVVEYPLPLQQVADQVRAAVAAAITDLVGMQVAEINVTVTDVHIPGDDDTEPTETRVV